VVLREERDQAPELGLPFGRAVVILLVAFKVLEIGSKNDTQLLNFKD
jgi:hypothetical protein